jgi:succinate dehydrogenase / fumarate reductase, cytochrome b subunit
MADTTTAKRQRPLSPHLQIYKPQITSVLSIVHRATGVALTVGLIPLAIWLAAAATGPQAYDAVMAVYGSIIGVIALMGWSFCLFYHLLNGIRHLLWDTGRGLTLPEVTNSGLAVVIGAAALTALSVIAGFVYW